jgi:hypothetical protein
MVLRNLLDHNVTIGLLCTTATLLSIGCITYYIVSDHHSKVLHRQEQIDKKIKSRILSSHQEMINRIKDQIDNLHKPLNSVYSVSQIAEIEENIMKTLESLDTVSFSPTPSFDSLREWRKTLIYNLQDHLKTIDLFQTEINNPK